MYSNLYDNEKSKYDLIEDTKTKYELQKKKVEHEKYIEDLMFHDLVVKISSLTTVSRYDYFINIFSKARSQIGLKTKKEREDLDLLTGFLLEDFFDNNKDFKLTGISTGGYDACYYRFDFKYKDANIFIQIPIYKHIDTSNIEFASYGKFCFGIYKSSCFYSVLKSSYRISEVAEFIKEYFGLK